MTARKLITLGDSIVAGGSIVAGPNWTELLQSRRVGTPKALGANNGGVGGHTSAQMLTVWADQYKNRGYTHAILMVGTNDLASSIAATTVMANINQWITEARADTSGSPNGIVCAVCTVLPRGAHAAWNGTMETQRLALNTSIRALTLATPIDFEIRLGGSGDPLTLKPADDWGDGLHPNAAGHVDIADEIDATLTW